VLIPDKAFLGHPSPDRRLTNTEHIGYCSNAHTLGSHQSGTDTLIVVNKETGRAGGDTAAPASFRLNL
jgi:hypothetical protein